MTSPAHTPVLVAQAIDVLQPKPGDLVVDCTIGLGGHSIALADSIGPAGRIVGFDVDSANLARSTTVLGETGVNFTPIHANFITAPEHLKNISARADIVIADLGFSSNQMEDPQRGFSFVEDGPLDMRLDPASPITAADLVAVSSEAHLADIIHQYGEEPLARRIARKLVQIRQAEPIRSTARLARLVVEAYGPRARSSRMHPATRTFMALRIAVNDELGALRGLLDHIVHGAEQVGRGGWLNHGARIAIISFHSLEDRMVKHAFAELEKRGLAFRINKKPLTATEAEIRTNPRSRSAKLRAVRIGSPNQI